MGWGLSTPSSWHRSITKLWAVASSLAVLCCQRWMKAWVAVASMAAVAAVAVEVMQWGSAKGSKAQGGGALQALQHGALHGRRGGVQQLRPVGLRQSNYIP